MAERRPKGTWEYCLRQSIDTYSRANTALRLRPERHAISGQNRQDHKHAEHAAAEKRSPDPGCAPVHWRHFVIVHYHSI